MKKYLLVWVFFLCVLLWGCGKNVHQHSFGDWVLKEAASCTNEGLEERLCTECKTVETRPVAMLSHQMKADNICKICEYVEFDPDAAFVELGVFSNFWYPFSTVANEAWDVKIWGNMVYRGSGDYNTNAGTTPILAFDMQNQRWVIAGSTADQAIHRYVEINDTLYIPGVDPDGTWDWGNFYVLDDGKWIQQSTLPNGLHNFDMIEFDGKIFAGLGTETLGNTVAVSQDNGKSFSFVPLYRDGTLLDTSGYEYSRTYAFVEYSGNLYALVSFKKIDALKYDYFIFQYADGKMVYQSTADSRLQGKTGGNCWQGKLEWKGVCYLTSTELNAVTDFSKPETRRRIAMPNNGAVSDILLYNDELYVLSFTSNEDMTKKAAIYKSATGEEDSFKEVVSFDYAGTPISFDFDGEHFYIGIGHSFADQQKTGMLLRVKPAA